MEQLTTLGLGSSASASEAESQSFLGASGPVGAATQTITANTFDNVGAGEASATYYIEVYGEDGAFSAGNPFLVTETSSGTLCSPGLQTYFEQDWFTNVDDPPTALSCRSAGGRAGHAAQRRRYLVQYRHRRRLEHNARRREHLGNPARQPGGKHGGHAVQPRPELQRGGRRRRAKRRCPGARCTGGRPLNPTCVYAVDLEADAIQAIINSFRNASSDNLQDVVIVGDDDVIPFFRYSDAEPVAPEDGYSVPLNSDTEADAALANDYYLSDDQYGATTELSLDATTLPVENVPVGRLVDTTTEIAGIIQDYLAHPTIKPISTLATGYSFMEQAATTIAAISGR